MDDAQLVMACLQGSDIAWAELVQRLSPLAWRLAWRKVGAFHGTAAARDVCQDFFTRLLENDRRILRRFDPGRASLARYAAFVVRSCIGDFYRKRQRDPLREAAVLSESDAASDSDALSFEMIEASEMDAAMAYLTSRERQVVDLFYRKGFTFEQAAAEMGVTEATVRSLKRKGIDKLKKFFRVF